MLNKVYNSHNYPFYIGEYDVSHHVTRIRMNLVKKLLTLSEMDAGDYVYMKGFNGEKRGTWHMVSEKKGVFPGIAKQFLAHAENKENIPKFATLPYFCYQQMDLSDKASYFVVRKEDMIDIISNGAKRILETHYLATSSRRR